MFEYWRGLASDPDPLKHKPAQDLLRRLESAPEIMVPFDDFTLLEKYRSEISELFGPLFPMPLQTNEIKALNMPFTGYVFNKTKRFQTIVEKAGVEYKWQVSDFDADQIYLSACIFVLNVLYKAGIDFKRPFYFDIPDKASGLNRRYRAFFNADFVTFETNENTRKISPDDIRLLVENFNDIALWKSKIPPNSYTFEGF
jgi:hypothetical protein